MSVGVRDRTESHATAPQHGARRPAIVEHLGLAFELAGDAQRIGGGELGGTAGAMGTDLACLPAGDRGAELLWPDAATGARTPVAAVIRAGERRIPIFARLTGDREAERLLARRGGEWSRVASLTGAGDRGAPLGAGGGDQPLTGRNGEPFASEGHVEPLASIWRSQDGSVFLPFDPDEVCFHYWSEGYQTLARAGGRRLLHRTAMRTYYRVRGLLPRPAQIWLRRRYARRQARTPFPRWPLETALHDFFDLFTAILADVAGEPLARIAPWPHGHAWALVLSHDVETDAGLAALDPILELERGLGLRSAWNFVPRRYDVPDERIRALQADGFEVGVHGLYHDGRDLESPARLGERLPGMRAAAERWGAVGFRSPATHRDWELMPQLGFDYDSSYPDTDPFEPQGGGCCEWLPFFDGAMVELPLTMPQDHTLFVILRHADERAWVQKAQALRARGGMAMIDTHPDYLLDRTIFNAYRRLLERFADDTSAWKALPCEVSAWWRRRAASRVERAGGEWVVSGPAAAQARVELVEGTPWR